MNELKADWYLQDGWLYTKFFFCECPMLEAVDRLPTPTWCQCTVGYTRAMFESIFGCAVESELMQSIKMGDDICLIRVKPEKDR